MLLLCHEPVCQCRVDCCFLLITMDPSLAAAVCIAAPQWFWFGLLLLLSFFLLPLLLTRTCPSTIVIVWSEDPVISVLSRGGNLLSANAMPIWEFSSRHSLDLGNSDAARRSVVYSAGMLHIFSLD